MSLTASLERTHRPGLCSVQFQLTLISTTKRREPALNENLGVATWVRLWLGGLPGAR
jgi:hypothetical protein